jgi:Protein of unknown function (DUF3047)
MAPKPFPLDEGGAGRRIRRTRSGFPLWISLVIVGWSLFLLAGALAGDQVTIEDWATIPVGTHGLPPGWQRQTWGAPRYDFTVVADGERRVVHMQSQDENSTITKDIKGQVNLSATPILEWSWKAVTLPPGGDVRHGATDDEVVQLYVDWPRFPEAVRSRIIGYVWDSTAPVGTIVKSEKTGTVTYIVVRSGPTGLGMWHTESRNVRDDFRQVYGEEPDSPGALSVAINTNNTHTHAEAWVGAIRFRTP